jgi:hypothetical protein
MSNLFPQLCLGAIFLWFFLEVVAAQLGHRDVALALLAAGADLRLGQTNQGVLWTPHMMVFSEIG